VIEPGRAGAARSASTARPGEIQVELGLQYFRESVGGGPAERRLSVEAALTVGLTERLEVTLEGEPLVRLRGSEDDTGAGDLFVGLKYRFFDPSEDSTLPTLGVLSFVKVPTASRPIGSTEVDLGLVALASFDLPWEMGLDLNAGVNLVGQRDGWVVRALLAAGLAKGIGGGFTLFTDVFYATREVRGGRDRLGLDAGVIWTPTPDVAFDVSGVTSLAGVGPDWGVRGGVSIRFGR
jgi:hypothetical protein